VADQPPDFETILRALVGHQVRFVIVGGLAMRLHGSAYITDDVDVGYARDLDNLSSLARALAPLHPRLRGAPPELPFRIDLRTLQIGQNFTLETDAGNLDVLGDIPGSSSFDELWKNADEKPLFGFNVRVASIPDLISMKRAAGRRKDQDHLRELEALQKLILDE
jgi:predicted nucleotidyltransferase